MKIAILGVSIAATAFAAPALADYYTVRQPSVAYTVWEGPSRQVAVIQARRWCAFEGMAFSDGATNRLGQVCDRGSWRYFEVMRDRRLAASDRIAAAVALMQLGRL